MPREGYDIHHSEHDFPKKENPYEFNPDFKDLSAHDLETLHSLQQQLEEGIVDYEDAVDALEKLRKLTGAIITVPNQYRQEIERQGYLEAHETYIPGMKVLAGMVGRKPLKVDSDDRFRVNVHDNIPLEPRFTGKPTHNKPAAFHGVFVVKKNKLFLGSEADILSSENLSTNVQ